MIFSPWFLLGCWLAPRKEGTCSQERTTRVLYSSVQSPRKRTIAYKLLQMVEDVSWSDIVDGRVRSLNVNDGIGNIITLAKKKRREKWNCGILLIYGKRDIVELIEWIYSFFRQVSQKFICNKNYVFIRIIWKRQRTKLIERSICFKENIMFARAARHDRNFYFEVKSWTGQEYITQNLYGSF